MKHTVRFERFDFTKKPADREEKTVEFEFPKITDDNIEEFDAVMWKAFFELPYTGVKGHFSSWLEIKEPRW